MAGDFDIAMTPFDNVVGYQEDQGEVHFDTPPDLFVFMGGSIQHAAPDRAPRNQNRLPI